jgi:hypothetical protein
MMTTTTTKTANQYKWRTDEPFDMPYWWPPERLERTFRGKTNAELEARYKTVLDDVPENTGMPIGEAREWHCLNKPVKCPLCVAWIDWDDELTALTKELRRRKAPGWR